jgi:DNA-binding MarR family transcriptional regulator/GNAT superfamily N-acetyltransferase
MDAALVEGIRSFNRTVTERLGALGDDFLGRGLPLGASRLLWEIDGDAEVRDLRRRLGLDSGYVARLLRSLERRGLVAVGPSPRDGRVRRATLTPAGRAERDELERRADGFASSLLEPLSAGQRTRLVTAMAEVERLLVASMVRIEVEDPGGPDGRWCLERYVAELEERFDDGFDPALSLPAAPADLVPPAGALLVARLRDRPVGCGALKIGAGGAAEIKRMWVSAEVRGLGLGRRILAELERRAEDAGVTTLRLETNRSLTEAIALYRRSGYREVEAVNEERYAHHWFEKRL